MRGRGEVGRRSKKLILESLTSFSPHEKERGAFSCARVLNSRARDRSTLVAHFFFSSGFFAARPSRLLFCFHLSKADNPGEKQEQDNRRGRADEGKRYMRE